ncbi:MAG TPA: hypothetical protein VMG12_32470 [Polyangiaceae bacterium]|nr:hypothetical protein [Polyangiaceae bacterium]
MSNEDGSFDGSISALLNYTDDAEDVPGALGLGGFFPSPTLTVADDAGPACGDAATAPSSAEPVTLDHYDGSSPPPTCRVRVSYWSTAGYAGQDLGRDALDVRVSVDGDPVALGGGIPYTLGRFPAGARVRVEARRNGSGLGPRRAIPARPRSAPLPPMRRPGFGQRSPVRRHSNRVDFSVFRAATGAPLDLDL